MIRGLYATIFAASALAFLVTFLVFVLSTDLGGIGFKPFTWHPILMMCGVIIMGVGITIYHADYGSRVHAVLGSDKESRRRIHGIIGALSAGLILIAWFIAWFVHRHRDLNRSLHEAKSMPLYLQVS